ncbi:MAG: nicotinamide-nucleotide amidohydrolase family protein [Rhodospirillaceae bacterium]
MDRELIERAEKIVAAYAAAGCRLVTAESCTGGLISACLTAVAGSSAVLERGYVTYSNAAKQQDLGVPADILARYGAVSLETAGAMAEGALRRSPAEVAIAVTGIAGPGGGSAEKPVGLVCFGLAVRGGAVRTEHRIFPGERAAVRRATVLHAFELLWAAPFTPRACD